MVPIEWPAKCADSTPRTRRARITASTRPAIEMGEAGEGERPDPGRSKRMTRKRAPTAGICGDHTLDVPPRPWSMTMASPVPSTSTAMRSMMWVLNTLLLW